MPPDAEKRRGAKLRDDHASEAAECVRFGFTGTPIDGEPERPDLVFSNRAKWLSSEAKIFEAKFKKHPCII